MPEGTPERGGRVKRTGVSSLTGLALAAVLYVAANALFNVSAPQVRLDVTEDGLFTLSHGTLATLARIDEPIELHFFLSGHLGREVPAYASHGLRVRELLAEVAAAAGGKVILREHDPKPFSRGEELAVSFGVQGVPVEEREASSRTSGLAGTNSVDDVETVPFFQPEREMLLEYDIARMIHALSDPEPTVVGVMGSLPVMGDMHAQAQGGVLVPWAIARHLKAGFDTIHLPESIDDLPASVDVDDGRPPARDERSGESTSWSGSCSGAAGHCSSSIPGPNRTRRSDRMRPRRRPVASVRCCGCVGHRGSGRPARRRPVDGAHDQRRHRGPPGAGRVPRVARRVHRVPGAGRSGDRPVAGAQPRECRLHPAGRRLAAHPRSR